MAPLVIEVVTNPFVSSEDLERRLLDWRDQLPTRHFHVLGFDKEGYWVGETNAFNGVINRGPNRVVLAQAIMVQRHAELKEILANKEDQEIVMVVWSHNFFFHCVVS